MGASPTSQEFGLRDWVDRIVTGMVRTSTRRKRWRSGAGDSCCGAGSADGGRVWWTCLQRIHRHGDSVTTMIRAIRVLSRFITWSRLLLPGTWSTDTYTRTVWTWPIDTGRYHSGECRWVSPAGDRQDVVPIAEAALDFYDHLRSDRRHDQGREPGCGVPPINRGRPFLFIYERRRSPFPDSAAWGWRQSSRRRRTRHSAGGVNSR